MNTVSYSNEAVQNFIINEFVPLKMEVSFTRPYELMERYMVRWTPTLLVEDAEGKVQHQMVGFVPPDDLLAHLKLGKGMFYFNSGKLEEAAGWFRRVFEEHPKSGPAPEAVFYLGVAGYRLTHKPSHLRTAYDTLLAGYPESEWSRRAVAYSAIPKEEQPAHA
ncbi:MAG: thioredoxin fold domain-containing protein [Actinomycetota bacterium]|nr:thioredoxin fold domain-containing protein [Actinomycetota bacterium]